MQVYRRMDIGTAKPTAARSRPRCRTTASISSNPTVDFTVAAVQDGPRGRARRHRRGRRRRADRRRHRSVPPGRDRRLRPAGRVAGDPCGTRVGQTDTATLYERLDIARPDGGVEDRTVEPTSDRAGPRGDARQRPTVQLVRPRGRLLPADERGADRHPPPAPRPPRADRTARARDDRRRARRRGADDRRRPRILTDRGAGARLQGNPLPPGGRDQSG